MRGTGATIGAAVFLVSRFASMCLGRCAIEPTICDLHLLSRLHLLATMDMLMQVVCRPMLFFLSTRFPPAMSTSSKNTDSIQEQASTNSVASSQWAQDDAENTSSVHARQWVPTTLLLQECFALQCAADRYLHALNRGHLMNPPKQRPLDWYTRQVHEAISKEGVYAVARSWNGRFN
jgi:hypothetical protein